MDAADYLYIPFPRDLYDELVRQSTGEQAPPEQIATLVRNALEQRGRSEEASSVVSSNHMDILKDYGSVREGYLWGKATIPNRSQIRTKQRGKTYYAEVKNGQLIFDGEAISPFQLIQRTAGYSRDPWQNIWIKLPTEAEYYLAEEIRSILESWPKHLKETGWEI